MVAARGGVRSCEDRAELACLIEQSGRFCAARQTRIHGELEPIHCLVGFFIHHSEFGDEFSRRPRSARGTIVGRGRTGGVLQLIRGLSSARSRPNRHTKPKYVLREGLRTPLRFGSIHNLTSMAAGIPVGNSNDERSREIPSGSFCGLTRRGDSRFLTGSPDRQITRSLDRQITRSPDHQIASDPIPLRYT